MEISSLLELFKTPYWYIKVARNAKYREIKSAIINLTSFLPNDVSLTRRAWHIINDRYDIPKCIQCNERDASFNKVTYTNFCSIQCSSNSPLTKDKIKSTMLDNYGVSHPMHVDLFKEKLIDTSIKKYGCPNPAQSDLVKENAQKTNNEKYGMHPSQRPQFSELIQQTSLDRYGVKFASQSDEFKQRVKDTNVKKYGVQFASQSDEFKQRVKNTNIQKYGVSNVFSSKDIQHKIKLTNLDKYGVENVAKLPKIRDSVKNTNKIKYGTDYFSQSHIPQDTLYVLKDKESLIDLHHTQQLSLSHIAKVLNVDTTTISNYFKKHNIEIKYYYSSGPEKELQTFLEQYVPIETNTRNIIYPFELDIYLPEHKLAIEYCGLYWHSELYKANTYHREKYRACADKGIRLIQIFENEWEENADLVKNKILHIIGHSHLRKIYARSCEIKVVSIDTKNEFFEINHIQGSGPSSINYGLEHNGELVACIGFIKQKDHFILNRYATSCNVLGGFTRLLKHFEREHGTPRIVTFADLRWSGGELYKNTGFVLDKELPPDYYWCKGNKLWHKFNWRHTTGLRNLENYNESLSESDNMRLHHYYKIWDCGKLRFVKN